MKKAAAMSVVTKSGERFLFIHLVYETADGPSIQLLLPHRSSLSWNAKKPGKRRARRTNRNLVRRRHHQVKHVGDNAGRRVVGHYVPPIVAILVARRRRRTNPI